MSRSIVPVIFIIMILLATACRSTRHVPDGEYLLDQTSIEIEGDKKNVSSLELVNYLRQTPNNRVIGFAKLQLATYNLSGKDTTKWYNRWIRKLGQPPVIYDSTLTAQSARQLRQALLNRGYNDVIVTVDTIKRPNKKKINVNYKIKTGVPHLISSMRYDISDTTLRNDILADSSLLNVGAGDIFDRNALDAERTAITERLRSKGYYSFTKDYITFIADTAAGSKSVDLTMNIKPPVAKDRPKGNQAPVHRKYIIRNVIVVTDYDPGELAADYNFVRDDTVHYNGITILYGKDRYLRPSIIDEKCFIEPGQLYSATAIDRTYEALGQLAILKYINIVMRQAATVGDEEFLDAYILISRDRKQGVKLELEGTNSEGDLGFGIGLTYLHRNLWKGSEQLNVKFRTSYESISGDLDGLINDRYTEYAGEVGLTFPKFKAPFLSKSFKQKIKATSEVAMTFNYQERPEYTRMIAGAGFKYKWNNRSNTMRSTLDLIDLNFVYLPNSTLDFIDELAPNPLLRYSYEDHLIMRLGYTLYKTNRKVASASIGSRSYRQDHIYTFRWSAETAGNLLYLYSKAFKSKREDGAYMIFGTQFSQYVKTDIDYSWTRNFDQRNSIAFHAGAGVAVPYGNSAMVPFEKRFYAGGANGVRGWGVRTLGPGSYDARNSVTDFINQCGDIRLDLNAEYRAKLFWVFEGALFIDAGNIWTIRDYSTQPGGVFKINKFYKQIALAYGIGVRMDFTYFLLRLDLGLKAHNPAVNQEPWPIIHPNWERDATFHFAVGYPF